MSHDMPRIAIFMTCYNHEKYVNEAIDSIINQTYQNWELYVVNDASTDKSGEIIASYTDKRIHFYDFQENTNYAGALKFLQDKLRDVDADYIACLSSDDAWVNTKLEKQLEIFHKYPQYKICLTWDKVIFSVQDKGYFENITLYSHERNRCRYEWLNYYFWNGNCFNQCSFMMPKHIFFKLNAFNHHMRQLNDFHMWYKVAIKYPIYLIEEELMYYRRHGNNLSEPDNSIFMRNSNEEYQILKEFVVPMDKNLFHRVFYRNLPYIQCETEEELAAEKLILFVSTNNPIKQQVALDIYFAHCGNEDFISILEEKYFFYEQDLLDLTGHNGLMTAFIASHRKPMFFSPISILTNAINKQQLTAMTLETYRYSTLFDLWNIACNSPEGKKQFDNIRNYIINLQEMRRLGHNQFHILFLIAQSSEWDVSEIIHKQQMEGAKCYVAFVPSIEETMHTVYHKNHPNAELAGAEIIDLYNEKELCLNFAYEQLEKIDAIYYVDCLNSRYECSTMASGYSLATEYYGVLKEETYQHMIQNKENQILEMMKDILLY